MSKLIAKKFAEELLSNQKLQKQLEEQKPQSIEDVVAFAAVQNFSFSAQDLKQVIEDYKAMQLSDDVLGKIYAGAYPTAVNNQITDSVT